MEGRHDCRGEPWAARDQRDDRQCLRENAGTRRMFRAGGKKNTGKIIAAKGNENILRKILLYPCLPTPLPKGKLILLHPAGSTAAPYNAPP